MGVKAQGKASPPLRKGDSGGFPYFPVKKIPCLTAGKGFCGQEFILSELPDLEVGCLHFASLTELS